jgi:membrane peptidoglycan carboxypeptidase
VSTLRRLLRLSAIVVAAGVLAAGTAVAVAPQIRAAVGANSSVAEDIDLAALDDFAVRSKIIDASGQVFTTLHAEQNRQPVSLDQVPQPVIDAILAVEDASFYDHGGINARAIVRALTQNVESGQIEQGGSTITQQLVKNALLSSSRDIDRKSREVALAIRLEQELTKDEILEKYLNTVYFGAGAYGVQAAAETYWGVDISELDYGQGAMLAAVISNPVAYDPTLHPKAALARRTIALERLVAAGRITSDQAYLYDHSPLPVRRCGDDVVNKPVSCGDTTAPTGQDYFSEQVKQQLLDDPRLGATKAERVAMVFGGGLEIHTTLDPTAQQAAQAARDSELPVNDKGITAAMVAVEPSTGAVRALVGGPGFDTYKYDIATQAPGRQTGSSFKTFTLLTAMEQGNLPNDSVGGGGSFANPGGDEDPYTVSGRGGTITSVTSASSNGAFVRLQQTVGVENVATMAARLGVDISADQRVLTMTLGVADTTPLQMASAYSAIPNGGVHQDPYFIERVEDRDGRVLIQHAANGTRAFSATTACNVTQVLQQNVKGGTGTRARLDRQAAAGKTGTTSDNADAWFVGFTPYLSTAVWMGIPSGRVPMGNFGGYAEIFGGTIPARIWHAFNEQYHAERDPVAFPTCDKPDRSARSVRGEGPLGGTGTYSSSSSSSKSRSTGKTTPSTPRKGGSTGTTTPTPTVTAPPPPITTPTTPPPDGPGG